MYVCVCRGWAVGVRVLSACAVPARASFRTNDCMGLLGSSRAAQQCNSCLIWGTPTSWADTILGRIYVYTAIQYVYTRIWSGRYDSGQPYLLRGCRFLCIGVVRARSAGLHQGPCTRPLLLWWSAWGGQGAAAGCTGRPEQEQRLGTHLDTWHLALVLLLLLLLLLQLPLALLICVGGRRGSAASG